MGTKTGIEWTDSTWNPIRGCSRVSEGCRNCYAEKQAYRFSQPGQPYGGLAVLKNGHASWTGKVEFVEKHLLDPLRWKAPRRIFVNSMSDLFHEGVTDEMRDRIFAVMASCPQHVFQVLTKRPERMRDYISRREESGLAWRRRAVWMAMTSFDAGLGRPEPQWPLPNVQLGVSVENQKAADERIPLLLQTPAAVRFISAEPLLGEVVLRWPFVTTEPKLDWVICGGESGPGARPMHPDWARGLRDQCAAAGVPFFFKQWGEWVPFGHDCGGPVAVSSDGKGHYRAAWAGDYDTRPVKVAKVGVVDNANAGIAVRIGKKAAGALLDGVEHKAFPEARA